MFTGIKRLIFHISQRPSVAVDFAAVAAEVLSDGLMRFRLDNLWLAAGSHKLQGPQGAALAVSHTCETHVDVK